MIERFESGFRAAESEVHVDEGVVVEEAEVDAAPERKAVDCSSS